MRNNIVIDHVLINNDKQVSRFLTKKETMKLSLKLRIKVKAQIFIKKYRGKLKWEGDLESMRKN